MRSASLINDDTMGVKTLPVLKIEKNQLYRFLFIAAFYLSAFQPLVLGLFKYFGINDVALKMFLQGLMYAPAIIYFCRPKINKTIGMGLFFTCFVLLVPSIFHSNARTYFLFLKNYIFLLFFLPFADRFSHELKTHISKISLFYAFFCFVEFFSVKLFPSFKLFIAEISPLARDQESLNLLKLVWRPLGAYLNIHTSGAILAISASYFYSLNKYKKSFFLMTALLLSGVKIWVVYILVFLLFAERRRLIFLFKKMMIPFLVTAPFMLDYFIQELSFSSHGSQKMLVHIFKYIPLSLQTWVPFGPVPETYDLDYLSLTLPTDFYDAEVSLYKIVFQFGFPLFIYYIGIIYLYRNRFINSKMEVALFATLIMFLHTSQFTNLTVFLIMCAMKFSGNRTKRDFKITTEVVSKG